MGRKSCNLPPRLLRAKKTSMEVLIKLHSRSRSVYQRRCGTNVSSHGRPSSPSNSSNVQVLTLRKQRENFTAKPQIKCDIITEDEAFAQDALDYEARFTEWECDIEIHSKNGRLLRTTSIGMCASSGIFFRHGLGTPSILMNRQ